MDQTGLLNKYIEIEAKGIRPQNAWYIEDTNGKQYIKPAVPFVGKNYFSQDKGCRVLLYASAENLTNYGEGINLLATEEGMERCRRSFEDTKNTEFFPSVHIQPINDGGLLIAAYQILKKVLGDEFDNKYGKLSPEQFLECICCSNYGKFTLVNESGNTNCDYANSDGIECLGMCHDYLRADIEILQPDIIIIPSGMYYDARQKELFFERYFPSTNITIVPIYQINARVFNCTVYPAMMKNKYKKIFTYEMLSDNELLWHKQAKRINQEKLLGLYAYIDSIL